MNRHHDLLSVREVAAELRVTPITVRRWVDTGELQALRLGTHERARIRVPRASVDQFVKPAAQAVP